MKVQLQSFLQLRNKLWIKQKIQTKLAKCIYNTGILQNVINHCFKLPENFRKS